MTCRIRTGDWKDKTMNLEGKRVLVVGSGKSGVAAAELLRKKGITFVLFDGNKDLDVTALIEKNPVFAGAEILLGELAPEDMARIDLVVLSPGVPTDLPMVNELRNRQIPIWGEIELAYHFAKGRIIAITGTNGKTTTKELISTVLSQAHNVLYTLGNLNNHIGVPTTLLRLKPEHDLAVIEMGANHPGEIKFLCEIAEPDYGIITNVGKAHLEGFGSFEGVIKTKGELYDFLRKKENSTIFIHHDNPYLMNMSEELDRIYYGTQDGLYINGRITDNSPYLAFEWKAGNGNEIHRIQTQLIGEYNFPNALAAITIGHFFGVEMQKIDEALAGYTPQNNRSQLKQTTDNTLIIDAYNANPTSMMAALQNFRNMAVPHKMLLLGDMRELGAESNIEHQKIVNYIKDSNFEQVWLVGEQFAATQHNFKTYANVQEVIKELETQKPKGYTILIKGSNGIKLSSTVEHL